MSARSSYVTSGMEGFSLDIPRAVKNYRDYTLEVKCGGVVRP